MKLFWLTYSILLLLRIIFDLIWVKKTGSMSTKIKLIATSIPMLILIWLSIHISLGWTFLWLWPLCGILWASIFDGLTGLFRHKNPFYMNENSWPDSWLLPIVQNGKLFTFFKVVCIIFFSGFLWYHKEKK
jgi:hypothetical protein